MTPLATGTREATRPDVRSQQASTEFNGAPTPTRWSHFKHWGAAFLVLWFLFLACNWNYVDSPPFEDQTVGLFAEASFLADTSFDYRQLRYEEPYYMDAGDPERPSQRSYMISIQPTLVAVVMRLAGAARQAIVVCHLWEFACAAIVCLGMFVMLRSETPAVTSALVIAALMTTPLVRVQTEMVGMDLPLAACATVWGALLCRAQYLWATAAAALAFLLKASGGALLAATAAFLVGQSLYHRTPARIVLRGKQGWAVVASLVAMAGAAALMMWGGTVPHFGDTELAPVPALMYLPDAFRSFPDVALLLVGAAIVSGVATIRRRPAARIAGEPSASGDAQPTSTGAKLLLCWLVVGLQLLAIARWIALPRYFVSVLPFVYVALSLALHSLASARPVASGIFAAIVVVNIVNSHGRLYPSIAELGRDDFPRDSYVHARNCAFVERSLEYRQEHESTIAAMRVLNEKYARRPILMPLPYLYHALLPRAGYVDKPLKAVNAGDFSIAAREYLKAASAGGGAAPPVLVWSNSSRITLPAPDEDEMIYRGAGEVPLVVYTRMPPADLRAPTQIRDWYLDHTWPGPWLAQRAWSRLPYLRANRLFERARREIDEALADPYASDAMREALRNESAKLQAEAARYDHARRAIEVQFPNLVKAAPELAEVVWDLENEEQATALSSAAADESARGVKPALAACIAQLRAGNLVAARKSLLERDIRAGGDRAVAEFMLGWIALRLGDPAAEQHFARLKELEPDWPEALYYLGTTRLERGELAEAADDLEQAVRVMPDFDRAHDALGMVYVRQGQLEQAREQFAAAVRLNPGNKTAYRHLQAIQAQSAR